MDGFVHRNLNWVRLGYVYRYGLFDFDGHVFLYRIRYMLHDWVGYNLFYWNRDFGLNWHSDGLVHGYFDWIRLGYSD